MIYKYLLGQIHSPDSFFWVGFISCVNLKKKEKKIYGPFLWMGFNCLKAIEPLRGNTFLLTTTFLCILIFQKSCCQLFLNSHVLIANSEKYTLADCALNMFQKGDGVCTSINFNLHAWYEVEIRFSDNLGQKETIDDITWPRRKKSVIYRLDIIFSITHVAQLMVSQRNFFGQSDTCRYPQRDIRRGIPNVIPCQEVEKWQ